LLDAGERTLPVRIAYPVTSLTGLEGSTTLTFLTRGADAA